jgi:ribulose-5-phosphate 4-epimerase/fuculose-1-phosphate aldolase
VADPLADARIQLALASRMLAHEGVLDAFGHVSLRHPKDPGRYLLSRARAPQLVEPDDIVEYDLDSEPVKKVDVQQFSERVIHGELFKARPDVMAICHHHAAAIMPFAISGVSLVPVFHLPAALGETVPFWDSRDDFGDTNLLVRTKEEGASHARGLGQHAAVLLRRHGATVVGRDLHEVVSRSIYMCQNAVYQMQAQLLGSVDPLTAGETKLAGAINSQPNVVSRTWEVWTVRLEEAGRWPPAGARKAALAKSAAKGTKPTSPAKKPSQAKSKGRKK